MASHSSGRNGRRPRGGSRRRGDNRPRHQNAPMRAPAKKSLLQRIMDLFTGGGKPAARPVQQQSQPARSNGAEPSRSSRKPEAVEVTTPRLYVGNLSFDATESDLFELFNGVGAADCLPVPAPFPGHGFGFPRHGLCIYRCAPPI